MRNIIIGIDGTIYSNGHLVKGARPALRRFIDQGYDIFILSRRLEYMSVEQLAAWLDQRGIPWVDIIGNGELPSYVHICVDDSPLKLLEVDRLTTVKHLLLFTQPCNKDYLDTLNKLRRVSSWKKVLDAL